MVLGAPDPVDVLDDDVLGADLDLVMTPRAAVELLRHRADKPRLVTRVGEADEARTTVREVFESVHPGHSCAPEHSETGRSRDGGGRRGSPAAKATDYAALTTPGLFNGFSLFYRADHPLMTPPAVLGLNPAPNFLLYQ